MCRISTEQRDSRRPGMPLICTAARSTGGVEQDALTYQLQSHLLVTNSKTEDTVTARATCADN